MTTIEHDYQIGDILVSQWGYDQTNTDFFQVVGVTPKSVKIRPIKGRIDQATGPMAGRCIPCRDEFTTDLFIGEGKTARVNKYGRVKIDDCRLASKWSGKPAYTSWYA